MVMGTLIHNGVLVLMLLVIAFGVSGFVCDLLTKVIVNPSCVYPTGFACVDIYVCPDFPVPLSKCHRFPIFGMVPVVAGPEVRRLCKK